MDKVNKMMNGKKILKNEYENQIKEISKGEKLWTIKNRKKSGKGKKVKMGCKFKSWTLNFKSAFKRSKIRREVWKIIIRIK